MRKFFANITTIVVSIIAFVVLCMLVGVLLGGPAPDVISCLFLGAVFAGYAWVFGAAYDHQLRPEPGAYTFSMTAAPILLSGWAFIDKGMLTGTAAMFCLLLGLVGYVSAKIGTTVSERMFKRN